MKQLIIIFSLVASGLINVSSYSQSVVVSATNMNIMYSGLKNPIEITACGYAPNQLIVTCSGGSISGSDGKYIVKPDTGIKVVIISVFTQSDTLGDYRFRVKDVPSPIIKWGGVSSGGEISSSFASIAPLIPSMENFDFAMYTVINSFDITFNGGSSLTTMSITGNQIPDSLKSKIKGLQKGTTIYFDEIKVTMPFGDKRTVAATFIIQ